MTEGARARVEWGVDLLRLALVNAWGGTSRLWCDFFPFALVKGQLGAARHWRREADPLVRPRCIGIRV